MNVRRLPDHRARAESELRRRFPRQFASPISIEVGPGWLGLVGEMLADVDKVLERRRNCIAWTRIYSKYASLRADFETPEYNQAWARKIEAIVGRYEVRATSRCERCGKAGTTHERGGWVCVACEEHAPAMEPEMKVQ